MNARAAILAFALLVACDKSTTSVDVVPPPTQLVANPQIGAISIHWQLTPGVAIANYEVEYSTDELNWQPLEKVVPPRATVVHSDVVYGRKYFYRVRGCTTTACSAWVETNALWNNGAPPVVTNTGVGQIGLASAYASATVFLGGLKTMVGVKVFEGNRLVYTTPNYEEAIPKDSTERTRFFTFVMPLLQQGTTYKAIVEAFNDAGIATSADMIFTTSREGAPALSFRSAISNFAVLESATSTYRVTTPTVTIDPGNHDTDIWGEIVSVNKSFAGASRTNATTSRITTGLISVTSVTFTGLLPGTYKYRVVAANSVGTVATDSLVVTVP